MKKLISLSALLFVSIMQSCAAQGFVLTSPDIQGQLSDEQVFNGFGCSGKNISPRLAWKNAPEATKSFALTVYDPDAPTGSGWWHWLIFDIPVSINHLDKGAGGGENSKAPKGSIQTITSFGQSGFGGACPPQGDKSHRYIFTVYALKVDKLGLDEKAGPALVGYYLNANQLAKASIMAYYGRN
ncbi:MAG: YbhB/YbcL family Raf kinase inhibitor-like protein [Enterobacterales bacterium]|nr:YbhB/YbcL family Raf kinase inhibitor-like protein [Enterobacterales bacterium]